MLNLYESILSDIEDNISLGDAIAADEAINGQDSPLRAMFSINKQIEKPFSVTGVGNNKTLTVDVPNRNQWVYCDKTKVADCVSGVNTVDIIGGANLYANNANDICNNLAKHIISDNLSVHCINALNNTDLTVLYRPKLVNRYTLPVITFYGVKDITNCTLSVKSESKSGNRLLFYNVVPTFKNVESDATCIDIKVNDKIFTEKSSKALTDAPEFNDIFEFGYKLEYRTFRDSANEFKKVTIKNMKDLRKLVRSRDYHDRIYKEWPVRLKPNAKITDFIDVSKFNNLNTIAVYDKNVGIMFMNTKHTEYKGDRYFSMYFTDMLKQTYQSNIPGHQQCDIGHSIPTTADGWKVMVFKM